VASSKYGAEWSLGLVRPGGELDEAELRMTLSTERPRHVTGDFRVVSGADAVAEFGRLADDGHAEVSRFGSHGERTSDVRREAGTRVGRRVCLERG